MLNKMEKELKDFLHELLTGAKSPDKLTDKNELLGYIKKQSTDINEIHTIELSFENSQVYKYEIDKSQKQI